MIYDFLFLLWSLAIGLTLGVALLPWYKKMGDGQEFAFLRTFTLFWPFFCFSTTFGVGSSHTSRLGGATCTPGALKD
jgi:hypothetical protein